MIVDTLVALSTNVNAMMLVVAVFIALHAMMAMGLMKMAQRSGIRYSWLAWIPLANLVLLIRLAGKRKVGFGSVFLASLVMGTACGIIALLLGVKEDTLWSSALLFFIPSLVFAVIVYIDYVILLSGLYRRFMPPAAVAFTVMSVFLLALSPVFILVSGLSRLPPVIPLNDAYPHVGNGRPVPHDWY